MIFVAVGTTDFDTLIQKMDEIAPSLGEEVVMQTGNGQYQPKNCTYFQFAPTLEPYYDQASLVVSHGGLGITTEVLEKGKKLIGVANPRCHGAHQSELLSTLEEDGYIIYCRDIQRLAEAIARAQQQELKPYIIPKCEIHHVIKRFLK